MKKLLFFIGLFISLFFASCSKPMPMNAIDVFLEAPKKSNSFGLHQEIVMPVSGTKTKIIKFPIVDIDSLLNADIVSWVDPQNGEESLGILLYANEGKRIQIFQASSEAISEGRGLKRFFLIVNGKPIGYCKIIKPIRDGRLFFTIESRSEGEELVKELENVKFMLNEFILDWREYKKDI